MSLSLAPAALAAPYTKEVTSVNVTSGTGETVSAGQYLLVSPDGVQVVGSGTTGVALQTGGKADIDGGVSVVINSNNNSHGVNAQAGTELNITGDVSVVSSTSAAGTYGVRTSGTTTVNGDVSVSNGTSNKGIMVSGNASLDLTGDITLTDGRINYGVEVNGANATANVTGDITITNTSAGGSNDGSNVGVYAAQGGTANVTADTITLENNRGGIFGGSSSGVYAYGAGSTVNVTANTIAVNDNYTSYGVRAAQGGTVSADADINLTGGNSSRAVMLDGYNGSSASLSGDITLTGGTYLYGVYIEEGNSSAEMTGNILIQNSANGRGLYSLGGDIDLNGGIDIVNGTGVYGIHAQNSYVDRTDGAYVTMRGGDLTIKGGSGNYGAYVTGGSTLDLVGDIALSGGGSGNYGAVIQGGGTLDLVGNIALSGMASSYGAYVSGSGSKAAIEGDITVSGDSTSTRGLLLYQRGEAEVTGNVSAAGSGNSGVYVWYGGSLDLTGNVDADNGAHGIYFTGNGTTATNGETSAAVNGNITASNGAYGVYATSGSNADLGATSLKINGDILADNATGVYLAGGSYLGSTRIDSGTIAAAGAAATAVNIYNADNTRITADEIAVEEGATGVLIQYSRGTQVLGDLSVGDNATGVKQNIQWSVAKSSQYAGTVNVYGENGTGLHVENGLNTLVATGDMNVTGQNAAGAKALDGAVLNHTGNVAVSGADAVGLLADSGATVNYAGDAAVNATNAVALLASGDGTINMHSGTVANYSDSARAALMVSGSGAVNLANVSGEAAGRTLILSDTSGDVYAENSALTGNIVHDGTADGTLNVTLSADSSLTGAVNAAAAGGAVDLTLADSVWNITDDSYTRGALVMATGSFVDYTAAALGTQARVDSLSGSGVFVMKTDIAAQTGDRLIIEGTSDGTYQIDVQNDGSAAARGDERVILVETADAGSEFSLTHIVELGAWQYELASGNDGRGEFDETGGRFWELHSAAGSEHNSSSNVGSAAVNTFVAGYLLNYAETNTLIQRLGDLRGDLQQSRDGYWFRVYGGKFSDYGRQYVRDFDMSYGGVQVGYDRRLENSWFKDGDTYAGVFVGYSDADLDYERSSRGGSGGASNRTVGMYATHVGANGFYIDAIAKYVWSKMDFDVLDSAGIGIRGDDVSSGGAGLSLETGRRIRFHENDKGGRWYIEPQLQLSWQHMSGGYFHASNGLRIGLDAYDSLLGRAGLLFGYETDRTNFYAKVSYVKEFDGDLNINANGLDIFETMDDHWLVYGLGLTHQFNPRNSIYLDVERASEGKFTQDWALKGGWRISF